MRTVQMTIDEELITDVDRIAARLGSTRSAFTRVALREAIQRRDAEEREREHKAGYTRFPARETELADWEDEQVWPT